LGHLTLRSETEKQIIPNAVAATERGGGKCRKFFVSKILPAPA